MDGDIPDILVLDTTSLKLYMKEIQTKYWRQHSKQVNYTASFKAPEKTPDRMEHSRGDRNRDRDRNGEKISWTELRPRHFDKIKLLNIAKQMAYVHLSEYPRPSDVPEDVTRSYDAYFKNEYHKPNWQQLYEYCSKLEQEHEKELAKLREGGNRSGKWSGL